MHVRKTGWRESRGCNLAMKPKFLLGGGLRNLALSVVGISAVLTADAGVGAAEAAEAAVVFMYHRFGESKYPSTNVGIAQFESHIEEIKSGDYTVKPLPEIVQALRAGTSLPDFTVGISIDDAFLSVYTEAWPRLKKAGLPFTLFVATDPVDEGKRDYMSWQQVAELAQSGMVTIGSQTASHLHMAASSAARNSADLAKSNARFKAKLGFVPKLIAYPYGEYSLAVRKAVRAAGFNTGFGQHSGVLHSRSDFSYLPRFALNETYGNTARFRLAARALPLPVKEVIPADPLLGPKNNPPPFGFTVIGDAVKGISRLACYTAGRVANTERLGAARIEVRVSRAFPPGRTRINCTIPAANRRWRWFGMQFYVPKR